MGVQGNYPGSGAYTKHYRQATDQSVTGSKHVDSHLKEGPATDGGGLVDGVNMDKGKGSRGDVGIANEKETISHPSGPSHVMGNAP